MGFYSTVVFYLTCYNLYTYLVVAHISNNLKSDLTSEIITIYTFLFP